MFFTLNSLGDFIILVVVTIVVFVIVGKDGLSNKDDGNNWDQWRTHK